MPLRRPRLLILLVTVLFVALTLRLGLWQLGKAQHKRAQAERMASLDKQAPLPWQGELGPTVWLQSFKVSGQWRPQGQIYLDNRIEQGRAGFHVLAPLELADGRWLLVNRGWLPKTVGQQPEVPLPLGRVELTVRMNNPTQRYLELAKTTDAGPVWQNLDWPRYRKLAGAPVVDVLAFQLDGSDKLSRNWPVPDLGADKNFGYAGQWFLFAALAVVLFVILHWKRRDT
ncbi:SURF1 family protein [Chitinimonas arctica]|uniref:SURF1-like protein n=1 Tax=Chitinimonas arctica TaxID=2594795 RepID=A0A516SH44_9NEIS|nr:SURF1 family protein [Chitinimonas arctica]QDQ27486.1 SURF1 family protein [Chitinimonas arctica]